MKDIFKKITFSSTLFLAIISCVLVMAAGEVMSAEHSEESADTVMPDDEVITGMVSDYSDRLVYVDGLGYRLCKNVKIYNTVNKIITMEEFNEVKEVKVFRSNGCVRKIKILRFAE